MTESSITIDTADGPMAAHLALPDARHAPAIIVAQEIFGVNAHIRDVTRRLAQAGFVAIAPELFHRAGAGIDVPYADVAKARPIFASLTNQHLEVDLAATHAALSGHERVMAGCIGVLGFCVGGFAAFLAACRLPVASAVAFYPGGLVQRRPGLLLEPLLAEAETMRAPLLLIFGADDASIPPADIAAVGAHLAALGKRHEVEVFPGAGHGFFCEARAAFHPQAAAQAWSRSLAWLSATLPAGAR
jgi:carboxymethylenebutenolidase